MRPEAIATMIRAATTRMMRAARCLHRARRGSAALEFAIAGPVLLLLILAVIENGLMLFAQEVLENATRDASRQIMIGAVTTSAQFNHALCNDVGALLDCSKLQFYVQASSAASTPPNAFPTAPVPASSLSTYTTATFVPGIAGQFVLVEVGYNRAYISPWLVGIVPQGWLLLATQAIKNEPFP
jgi:Flp pilus assembly protein TadG